MIDKDDIKKHIEGVLSRKSGQAIVEEKLESIESGDVSPFFLALFGTEITLTAKIAQSYQTKFGMCLWEPIARMLAQASGWYCETQYKLLGTINSESHQYITELLEDKKYQPNRQYELEHLRDLSASVVSEKTEYPDSTVDVYIRKPDGTEICIDITTVKPSKKEFRTMKRKLLMWAAINYSQCQASEFHPYIAVPYNPNSGDEYNNHKGTYDRADLLVGDELWKLVSDNQMGTDDLVEIFEGIGKELRLEIQQQIEKMT